MPINTEKCRRYRDTWAAPGSQLFEALEVGNEQLAAKIYRECENRLSLEQGHAPEQGRFNCAGEYCLPKVA